MSNRMSANHHHTPCLCRARDSHPPDHHRIWLSKEDVLHCPHYQRMPVLQFPPYNLLWDRQEAVEWNAHNDKGVKSSDNNNWGWYGEYRSSNKAAHSYGNTGHYSLQSQHLSWSPYNHKGIVLTGIFSLYGQWPPSTYPVQNSVHFRLLP